MVEAVGIGVTKLVVEVAAEQEATVAMFTKLGFEPEGLFRDHVRDQAGELHDLLVLAHFVDDRGRRWPRPASTRPSPTRGG